jgi:hypothetical protein
VVGELKYYLKDSCIASGGSGVTEMTNFLFLHAAISHEAQDFPCELTEYHRHPLCGSAIPSRLGTSPRSAADNSQYRSNRAQRYE